MSKLEVFALSNIGKSREINQDNFYCNGIFKPLRDKCFFYRQVEKEPGEKIYAVLDGMGGLRYGEQAAHIGVEALHSYIQKRKKDMLSFSGRKAVYRMNEAICAEMRRKNAQMGSTATILKYLNGSVRIYNVGDSKALLCHNGTIKQISEDHTEQASYMRLQGSLGIQIPLKKENALTQYLGIEQEEFVIEPAVSHKIQMLKGDIFLLCSDGLTGMVESDMICNILSAEGSLEEKGKKLEKLAMDAGGKDNITIVLLQEQ